MLHHDEKARLVIYMSVFLTIVMIAWLLKH